MPELRAMAEDLGFTDVATYINSGNLIISSPKKAATVEQEISQGIKNTFGRQIDVTVRTPAQLKKILADNPYPDGNPSQVTVAFLMKAPAGNAKERVAAVARTTNPSPSPGSRSTSLLARHRKEQAGREVQRDHRRERDSPEHPDGREGGGAL